MNNAIPDSAVSDPTQIEPFDVICFSHLRWNFVYQRPQHLMSRFAKKGRVFFIEEPIFDSDEARLDVTEPSENVFVCVPHLSTMDGSVDDVITSLVDEFSGEQNLRRYINWFYTPMMLEWSRNLSPVATVYDCMDELSGFKNAPPALRQRERDLFARADLVFTGGRSLYEAKRHQHKSVHAFPSSIDVAHFARALYVDDEDPQQSEIPRPRVGFVGVIDERADLGLLEAVADLRGDLNFVMVGPVVKIDDASLPRRANIHYLGQRNYMELPVILAGWDVAILPFALNESTRYISPTKTPEYLAAGLPVVSTPIADVVDPYGKMGLVCIAATAEEFAKCLTSVMEEDANGRRAEAAEFLTDISWDKTFNSMYSLIAVTIEQKYSEKGSPASTAPHS